MRSSTPSGLGQRQATAFRCPIGSRSLPTPGPTARQRCVAHPTVRSCFTAISKNALGTGAAAAKYALSRPAFSAQELAARFAHMPDAERDALIALLVRERLVEQYTPD